VAVGSTFALVTCSYRKVLLPPLTATFSSSCGHAPPCVGMVSDIDDEEDMVRQACRMKREPAAAISDTIRVRLGHLENQMVESMRRLDTCKGRSERDQLWQDIDDLVIRDLYYACGYSWKATVGRIKRDFGCCEFQSRSRWGKDRYEQNDLYSLANHVYMVQDLVRVGAYRTALEQMAKGLRVLDVGAGPFCLLSRQALLAGAASVDCVEQNEKAVTHAIELFLDEVDDRESEEMCLIGASLTSHASLRVHAHRFQPGMPSLSLTCKLRDSYQRSLQLFQGFSSEVPLPGGYDLVVHEILGHIASSEGAVDVLMNLRQRGLLSHNCIVVPRKAVTFFTPTEQVDLSCLERILHLQSSGGRTIRSFVKYNVKRFPKNLLLAAPACFEYLDFAGSLSARQHYVREFYTNRSAIFDGLHFHMVVDMHGGAAINTLHDKTSWNTVYIRLLDPGMFLPARSRIVCKTSVELDCSEPRYFIEVALGPCGSESVVAKYSWSGC